MPLEWKCDYCGEDKSDSGEEPVSLRLDAGVAFVCKECAKALKNEEGGH